MGWLELLAGHGLICLQDMARVACRTWLILLAGQAACHDTHRRTAYLAPHVASPAGDRVAAQEAFAVAGAHPRLRARGCVVLAASQGDLTPAGSSAATCTSAMALAALECSTAAKYRAGDGANASRNLQET